MKELLGHAAITCYQRVHRMLITARQSDALVEQPNIDLVEV